MRYFADCTERHKKEDEPKNRDPAYYDEP